MIEFINGVVEDTDLDAVVVNCQGMGYRVFTNPQTLKDATVGQAMKLYTQLIVREDAFLLFGFSQREDKQLFNQLMTVGGVGPRLALAILSAMSPTQVAIAILNADEKALTRVPGLGKKGAQRLILELKGKIQMGSEVSVGDVGLDLAVDDTLDEAVAILMAMGFPQQDSAAAVALVRAEGGTSEVMAMNALRRLDRGR